MSDQTEAVRRQKPADPQAARMVFAWGLVAAVAMIVVAVVADSVRGRSDPHISVLDQSGKIIARSIFCGVGSDYTTAAGQNVWYYAKSMSSGSENIRRELMAIYQNFKEREMERLAQGKYGFSCRDYMRPDLMVMDLVTNR